MSTKEDILKNVIPFYHETQKEIFDTTFMPHLCHVMLCARYTLMLFLLQLTSFTFHLKYDSDECIKSFLASMMLNGIGCV